MFKRAAIIGSAILLGNLATIGLSPVAAEPANTADECLAAPNTETPKGSHWFYRLEKGTKRKCWYLADASKAAKTAAAVPAPRSAEQNLSEAKAAPMQPTVANARAEMTSPQPAQLSAEDAKLGESIWPPAPDQPANAASNDNNELGNPPPDVTQGAAVQPANAQNWNIAQRWPEQNTPPGTAASDRAPSPPAATVQNGTTPPALTVDKPAATTATKRDISFDTTPMLIVMLAGALIFAAITGRMIVKSASRRSNKARGQRRDIWGDYQSGEGAISAPNDEASPPWPGYDEPTLRPANDPSNEIEKLLSRAAKRSAA